MTSIRGSDPRDQLDRVRKESQYKTSVANPENPRVNPINLDALVSP